MSTFKTILLILMLVTLEMPLTVGANDAMGHPITSQTTSISITEMDDATLMQYARHLQETKPALFAGAQGVLVLAIAPGSQAEKKGLLRGDIVVAYNGQRMNSTEQLISTIQANAAKPQVELQFIRAEIVQVVVLQGGKIGIGLTDIAEEVSLEQFSEKFFTAMRAKDVNKIWQLLIDNPNTAEQFQKVLTRVGEDELAGLVGKWRQSLSGNDDENNSVLDSLQEEGAKAYYAVDYPTALEKWQAGLDKARELGDRSYISQFINNLGMVYNDLGQYQTALDSFQQSLTISREIQDRRGEGNILTNIGVVYDNLGQYQTALDYHQQSLKIKREIKDRRGEGSTLTNIGNVNQNLGQYQTALDYFQQALTIHREIKDRRGEGADLNNIGMVYDNLGQYQTALDYYQQSLKIKREIKDRRGEGGTLTNIGNVNQQLSQYQTALESFQQALTIHREIKDKRGEGADLGNIGVVYDNLGQYQTALDYFQQSLKITREIKNRRGEGIILGNIGNVNQQLSQYQTALDYYQQSLAIDREIKNRRGEGSDLGNIGVIYQQIGQYQTALDYFQQSLKIKREIKNRHGEGGDLNNIGMVYANLAQYQTALDYYQQSLEIKREIKDRRGEGSTLTNIGGVYDDLAQYQTALDYYQQALTIHREINDRHGEETDLNNIGVVYQNLAQYQTALDYFQQALTIGREINDRRGEGSDLGNIGNVYDDLGEYQTALDYFQQALAIHREINDRHGEGTGLNNIGVVYWNLGQYQTALDYFQQSLTIEREVNDKHGEGTDLNNIGNVYYGLGEYQTALDYFQQALTIAREIKDRRGEGMTLGNIGNVSQQLSQYQTALDYYQQALTIAREIKDRRGEGNNLSNIGVAYSDSLGEYQTALDYFQQALTIAREIKNKRGEGMALGNIGDVYQNLGKYQQAKNAFQDSATILETIGSDGQWAAQRGLAFSEAKLNQLEPAIQHYEQALDNIEKLRAGITAKEHKISFMRDKLQVYDELIALLQSLHPNHPKKGYDRKALEIFERKQGRVFLEEMGKSGARRFANLPENITQQEQSLDQQWSKTQKDLEQQRSKPFLQQNHELITHLEQRQQQLETQQQALQTQIQQDYPNYYALKYPQPVDLATLQNQVLQADERMLVYAVMENSTVLWVIGPHQLMMLTLPVSEEILTEDVDYFRGVILNRLPEIIDEGLPLYQKLIPDAAHQALIGANTLYIVPTGPLYGLPFETLVTKATAGTPHYLIQDYAIAYLSSASLLKILRDAQARRQVSPPQPLLAFADPVYPPCQKTRAIAQVNKGLITELRTRAYLKVLDSTCFVPLPATGDEARAIAHLFKVPEADLYLDERATRRTIFQLNERGQLDDYRYLLFSVHGILPNEIKQITQPALVLSHPLTEGYLTMADVFSLELNSDFINLSACNTGGGKSVRGEGIMGLTRAFMYAGTPAISVTLWSVESESAKTLSIGIFANLKAGKKTAAALRQIKLKMIEGKASQSYYKNPYYWAPFVLYGDAQ